MQMNCPPIRYQVTNVPIVRAAGHWGTEEEQLQSQAVDHFVQA